MTDNEAADHPGPLSAAELRAVFNSVNDAIFVHDSEGNIIDVNRAAIEMYGYSREEIRNGDVETTSSGIPPYTQENAAERLERAAAGQVQRFEWQGQDSNGNIFWEEVSLSRTIIDGEVRVLAIVRDIHERKDVERRFQTLIDNLPGIVYRCRNEPGWPMIFVGGQSEELTGYSAETIESGAVSWGEDIIHPDDRAHLQQEVESALTADEPFELTYRIRTAEGEKRWMWERGRQVDIPRRSATILEGFITDITDRKQYEQQIEDQRNNLDVLNQVVRHDIRNDLQLIHAYTNMLDDHVEGDAEAYREMIMEATREAIHLTETARDLSETLLETDGDCSSVQLRDVLTAELEAARSEHEEAVFTVDGSIPDVAVVADEMLGSIFRNLLTNAVVHNDKAQPRVSVSVNLTADLARIQIADNGPGIPDSEKEGIFGKGEKGLGSPGTGIGLYLVQTLVDRYDGAVWVEDNEPDGAIFIVELLTSK